MTQNEVPLVAGAVPTLGRVQERFEDAAGQDASPADEILESWLRSSEAGLRSDRLTVPYDPNIDDESRLSWAAGPVIKRIGQDLEGSKVGLLLSDHRGHVIDRREGDRATSRLLDRIQLAPGFRYAEESVGTNAIGAAIEQRRPSQVEGQEHFADAMVLMFCTAVPVTDPASGRLLGVVDLSTSVADASPLMRTIVNQTAWEIEQRLLEDFSAEERILREHFLRARRHVRGPLVAVSERELLVNGAASGFVATSDRALIWEWAQRTISGLHSNDPGISLPTGELLVANCEPVFDGTRLSGALICFGPKRLSSGDSQARDAIRTQRLGWESFTTTEHVLAELVAQGLTNREAADHMFLSPHTIDFHLRKMFQKLGVRSRVELTRALVQKQSVGPLPKIS